MPHIDCFFGTISPYAYFSGTRPQEVADRHGASVTYRPLDMAGLFSRTGGTPLPQRHQSRQEYRLQELRRQSRKLGLPLNVKPAHWPTNPAPSSYAIIAAQKEGGDVAGLVHRICAACWAEERDIADDEVIRDCLSASGFDPALADKGLLAGAEAYGRNLEDAVNAGVFGSPFFVLDDGERFWGQDRIEDMDLHLAGKI
ncbi:2-hydroxychromene-2-carboxylate isomerase [Roseitranquillus sediminis]|uniref:2-hydroxychromene-2-carboxylate isomerase n=1 Tax=Roseitranquillus sediminis TaxID=2809051 RepID=UPI001D0CDC03|nr:2-hydroxychromene-2-carboxylate isomerase [Roseitranquillus sediminis]MBM9594948.1 2-hydroxychromene-2-carboxylate isomerase [Roseitranquillus sediminis]